ncbi:MAG: hypothetical protein MJH10_11285 [Epibacterium sp.]|nr:hypothetical protein [Epibacterium sp.]NQX74130.1 hypothetical protein [Epibacterium sp.]
MSATAAPKAAEPVRLRAVLYRGKKAVATRTGKTALTLGSYTAGHWAASHLGMLAQAGDWLHIEAHRPDQPVQVYQWQAQKDHPGAGDGWLPGQRL